jgi:hypothetical protein
MADVVMTEQESAGLERSDGMLGASGIGGAVSSVGSFDSLLKL